MPCADVGCDGTKCKGECGASPNLAEHRVATETASETLTRLLWREVCAYAGLAKFLEPHDPDAVALKVAAFAAERGVRW